MSEALFVRGAEQEELGEMRSAFHLFMRAAKAGHRGAQLNVGYFYDTGLGVRRNRSAAMYWYKRAYRRGDGSAANNIGTIWRDEKKMRRALAWFEKAIRLGNDGSNFEIAKHYLRNEHDPAKAIEYLRKVCESQWVADTEVEEAKRLLREANRELKRLGATAAERRTRLGQR